MSRADEKIKKIYEDAKEAMKMEDDSELRTAYSELGEAAATLHFAGYSRLAEKARNLQSEVGEYL